MQRTKREQLQDLITEAEIYLNQGLLEESLEIYRRTFGMLQGEKVLSRNTELIESIKKKIATLETDLAEINLHVDPPHLPKEIQDLITRIFSFSKNQDMAALEGAVALAKFGQYEKSLVEFQKLEQEGTQKGIDKGMEELFTQFNAILSHLKDSYQYIREQSALLNRYARELSQSYKKIKEEQELRDMLSRYVGQNVVERLVQSGVRALWQTERKEVSILFADIRSFTVLSEKMAAEEIVTMLNQIFSIMADIIFKNNGVLDKFIGDEIMAVFGQIPSAVGSPCDDALRAALAMQDAAANLMKIRRRQGKETFEIGIGINTGNAVIGNVGSRNRLDYTVIGDCVNTAARLQQASMGGEILISEQTYKRVQGHFQIEKKGRIKLKNKAKPILCYRVIE